MNVLPQLDRGHMLPLQDQLFEHLRQLIISGKLKPNTRVIATRFLAEQTGVSRTTVLLAYEKLISEGYLETRPAIGTFVATLPPNSADCNGQHAQSADVVRQATLYPPAIRLPPSPDASIREGEIDFRISANDPPSSVLPKIWIKEIRESFGRNPEGFTSSQLIAGIPSLRKSVADHLAVSRGIQTGPDEVIILAGQRQACSLIGHLFQRSGDNVVVEAHGNKDIRNFFKVRGAKIVDVPIDDLGLITECLPRGPVSLAYVSSTRQDPIGGVMPQSRRQALIQWAREIGAYLIEDDCGIEPHYQGVMPPPIATIDTYGLTFYLGKLANVLGGGLNLNYLVAPPEFVEPILAMKAATDSGCGWLEQIVAADLLSRGVYDQYLRRFRKISMERRDCLIAALQAHFGDVRLIGTESGTCLTWVLPEKFGSARAICERARRIGVCVESVAGDGAPGDSLYYDRALIFNYAALTPQLLQRGVGMLAKSIAR